MVVLVLLPMFLPIARIRRVEKLPRPRLQTSTYTIGLRRGFRRIQSQGDRHS